MEIKQTSESAFRLAKSDSSLYIQIPCPLCGQKSLEVVSRVGQFRLPAHISICVNDGLVFLNPRWSNEKYGDFYRHEYDHYYRPTVFASETDEQKYRTIKKICSRVAKYLIQMESALDIGAGMGYSLQYIRLNYPNIRHLAAIESSEHCLYVLKNEIKAEILASDVDQVWGKAQFDFIIMRHVLEHFLDPIEVLKKVHNSLTEVGIVYLAVPNMMKPIGSLKNYWFRAVHVFYFSEVTLVEIAARTGLTPILLDATTSELWGIFRKIKPEDKRISPINTYQAQMKVIRKQQILSIYYDLLSSTRRFRLSRLKDKIKQWHGKFFSRILK